MEKLNVILIAVKIEETLGYVWPLRLPWKFQERPPKVERLTTWTEF